ncbi:MAG: NAD(P)H-hydrate dehydratase, partial [Deltaproteobacteria bacterium]|nr:NAD(P)H-hydrate dehydratase [Deltaproteobacteria bacterium]
YKKLRPFLDKASSIVIGPGLGASKEAAFLVEMLLRDSPVPLVIDADGLNVLRGNPRLIRKAKAGAVITPHPGEAARLLGISGSDIQSERLGSAERLAGITGAVVVLKGASTIIADPSGEIFINPTGNPGLSTAGTGDVLSGMIGAFLGMGIRRLSASAVAVYIHGLAADEIKKTTGEAGMLATGLIAQLPAVLNGLSAGTQKR